MKLESSFQTSHPAFRTQLVVFGLVFILMASKSPDSLSHAQFWAEDGSLFFQQQYGSHLPLLGVTYAGYIHLIPRLVAWLAAFFSLSKAPFIYNLCACLLATLSTCYTIQRLRPIVPLAISFAVFLFAPINGEIFGTLANVQWFTQLSLMVLCLPTDHHEDRGDKLLVGILVMALGLTGPAAIFITAINLSVLTLAQFLIMVRPTSSLALSFKTYVASLPKTRIIVTLACAVIQILCIVNHASNIVEIPTGAAHYSASELFIAIAGKMLPVHIFGFYFLNSTMWILVELGVIVAIIRSQSISFEAKMVVLQLFAFSIALVFSAAALKDAAAMEQLNGGDRYFYAFKFVFWWMFYIALAGQFHEKRKEILFLLLGTLIYIGVLNSGALQRRPLADLDWRQNARELKTEGRHEIPINPAPWKIKVTTRPLLSRANNKVF